MCESKHSCLAASWVPQACHLLRGRVASPVLLLGLHNSWEELLAGNRQRLTVLTPSGASLEPDPLRACYLRHCHYLAICLRGLGLPWEMYCPCYCARCWWRSGTMSSASPLLCLHGASSGAGQLWPVGPWPGLVNKVLLEHTMLICLHVAYKA